MKQRQHAFSPRRRGRAGRRPARPARSPDGPPGRADIVEGRGRHRGNTGGYPVYTWIAPDARHETVLMMNEDPKTVGDAANAAFYELLNRSFCDR